MNHIARFVAETVVAVILVLPVVAQAGPRSHVLDEDAALALLERTLKHDGVYADRISLDCVVYRRSGKIEWLERIEDNWRPYNPAEIR